MSDIQVCPPDLADCMRVSHVCNMIGSLLSGTERHHLEEECATAAKALPRLRLGIPSGGLHRVRVDIRRRLANFGRTQCFRSLQLLAHYFIGYNNEDLSSIRRNRTFGVRDQPGAGGRCVVQQTSREA
jgi:hypothetical protein